MDIAAGASVGDNVGGVGDSLDEAVAAIKSLEDRTATGKVVIEI